MLLSATFRTGLALFTPVAGYGVGYAWSPSSVTVSVGDTVKWGWNAPAFQRVGYRVFSVSSPAGTTYEGGPFKSGDTKTEKGDAPVHYYIKEIVHSFPPSQLTIGYNLLFK